MFRPVWTGVGGDIITRASARDGEGYTGAREGREERCSDGHGELQLRRGPDSGGNGNVDTTLVLRLNGEVAELEEATVELWVS